VVARSSRPASVGAQLWWSVGVTAATAGIAAPGSGTSDGRWRVIYQEGPAA
jgi:hypothetical protein